LGRSSRHRAKPSGEATASRKLTQRMARGAGSESRRPLARDTSAGIGRKPRGGRKAQTRWKRRRHPDSTVDVADGASTPSGGLPPSPARAGRDPSTGANRGSGGRAVVLVDCSGCRSRREASGPSRPPCWATSSEGVGSSHPASCSGGEGASEAGSWRRSRDHGGGLSPIPEGGASRSAGERALVEGRRPGFDEAVVFDEAAVEASLAAFAGWIRPKGRSRTERAATEGVRGYVASSARGRKRRGREAQRGGAFDRGSARTAQRPRHVGVWGLNPKRAQVIGYDDAEAGGSPSSEAPPGDPLEAIGRGRVGAAPRAERSEEKRARESGSPLGARVVGRLQKSGRRIFPAPSARSREANRDGDGIA